MQFFLLNVHRLLDSEALIFIVNSTKIALDTKRHEENGARRFAQAVLLSLKCHLMQNLIFYEKFGQVQEFLAWTGDSCLLRTPTHANLASHVIQLEVSPLSMS